MCRGRIGEITEYGRIIVYNLLTILSKFILKLLIILSKYVYLQQN